MAKEDETSKCSRIGSRGGGKGIGRPSKKPKPKKVPQRGLGVAQLERIRLEEERKEAIASSTKSSYDMHLPQLWSPHEFEFEKERFGMDHGLISLSSLPCESNLTRSLPNWMQRTQVQQYPSSSLMSVSSRTSSTPPAHSSVEPPSNQNYSVSYVSMRPEEKVIGIKRPNPFSLDVPPVSSFNFEPPIFPAPMKTSETISCGSGSGSGFNLGVGNSTLREIPSLMASNSKLISKKINKENENLRGDFLALAPPTLTSCSHSMSKSPSIFLGLHHQEYPYFDSLSCQGIMEDQMVPLSRYNQFNQQEQNLYSFFPPAAKVAQIGQQSDRFQNCNVVGESLDLNLKL